MWRCGVCSKGGVREMIGLVIYGDPVPQGRPRFSRNGHTYSPQRSAEYRQWVRLNMINHVRKYAQKPLEKAVLLYITFYMGIPTSWGKQKRMEAAQGKIRPTGKRSGDLDNLVKMIQDAGNGILWADDSIITDLVIKKRYTAELARVEITATEVQE